MYDTKVGYNFILNVIYSGDVGELVLGAERADGITELLHVVHVARALARVFVWHAREGNEMLKKSVSAISSTTAGHLAEYQT